MVMYYMSVIISLLLKSVEHFPNFDHRTLLVMERVITAMPYQMTAAAIRKQKQVRIFFVGYCT